MKPSFFRALKTSALAISSLALIAAEPPKEITALTQAQKNELESIVQKAHFSSTPNPRITGIQLHHVIDKNGDGKFQAPEEIERIYVDSSLQYHLVIKDPIPPKGFLAIVVPQDLYWGTTIDVTAKETTKGRTLSSQTYTNCVDLTTTGATNSYRGKPQTITIVTPERRKHTYEQKQGMPLTEKRTYYLTVMGDNGMSHSCVFTIDYSVQISQTNTVPTLVHGQSEKKPAVP